MECVEEELTTHDLGCTIRGRALQRRFVIKIRRGTRSVSDRNRLIRAIISGASPITRYSDTPISFGPDPHKGGRREGGGGHYRGDAMWCRRRGKGSVLRDSGPRGIPRSGNQ